MRFGDLTRRHGDAIGWRWGVGGKRPSRRRIETKGFHIPKIGSGDVIVVGLEDPKVDLLSRKGASFTTVGGGEAPLLT